MTNTFGRGKLIKTLAFLILCAGASAVSAQQFNILKPSTAGIPGEEVRIMKFDPAGNLWVFGRHYFWGEAGLAMLSADQLPYEPLPGGGFDTGRWKVWSNVHHPIPSPYAFDLGFSADGQTLWLATEGGLTRFRPGAATPQEMWKTWDPSNSPMTIMGTTSVAVDHSGNVWVVANNVQNYPEAKLYKLNPATEQWAEITMRVGNGEIHDPYAISIAANGDLLASIRTFGGLGRYNGTAWTIMPPNGGGLSTPLEDPQGNIWGFGAEGLWRWNGTAWRNWSEIGGTSDLAAIGLDRNGVVNVGNWSGLFYKMIGGEPVLFLDADDQPSSFYQRPDGDIWIHNYGGAQGLGTVRHYNGSGQLLERFNNYNAGLGDYFVNRITSDSRGDLWFASGEAGLVRMTGSDGAPNSSTKWRAWGNHNAGSEPYPWAGNEPMYSVYEDANGIFWLGGNGVGRWDSNTGQFTNFWNWQNSNIDTAGVTGIVRRGDTIWVGTGYSGCFWLNGNTWTRVQLSEPWAYSSNNVRAMTVDTAGNLWVASEFGLRKFAPGNNATFELYHQDNSGLMDGSLNDVESDPRGGIWVATYSGLARFDGMTWTTYNQANTGMPGTAVHDVARRPSDGLIAIANTQGGVWPYTGGVSTFDGATWIHYTRENSPLTHWQVTAVEFDGNGNLWASTMSEGVVQILIGASPTPSPTPVATPAPTATPAVSPSASPTPAPTATPVVTPTATPGATPTPNPSPTATPAGSPTPTPTPGAAAQAINLSTRMRVQTGDDVGIGGFIVTGSDPKHVLIRAIGPSLSQFGVLDALADPVLELHGPAGFLTITNNNWRENPAQEAMIEASGIEPADNFESAIDATLAPGTYTAVVRGNNNASGAALVEVYDLDHDADSRLANISTRAFISTGDDIVIAGFILGNGSGNDRIVVRGLGPSLGAAGVPNVLANPTLELRDNNGALVSANNDWQDDPAQAAEVTAAGLAPGNNLESAIAATLPPGLYTALLSGLNNSTGNGLVEVYDRGAGP